MKVGIFRNSDAAQDLYRATLPIQKATKNNAITSCEIWTANLLYEASARTNKFWEVMDSDIYLIQRLAGQSLMDKIKNFVSESKPKTKIVIDHDDDIFNVSPLSNHYGDYGTNEIKIIHGGKVIHEWKDGVNINLKENEHRIDEVKRTLERADLVTVTTENLAEAFKPYNTNVKVLPNCVDLKQWNKLDIKRKNPDEIRICWAGGHSHWEDLFLVKEPLIQIAKKYPNVKIVMVGYMPMSMEKDFKPGQIEFHEWVDTAAHPYRMASLDIDIAIIPLKDTPFNKGKSAIKWIEFSSLQIPSVTSYIDPYKEMADLGKTENGVFIEQNDKEGWIVGLETLIESKDRREHIGKKARKTVEDNFDINLKYYKWVNCYRELLNKEATIVDSIKSSAISFSH